jgi:hypothetical protein
VEHFFSVFVHRLMAMSAIGSSSERWRRLIVFLLLFSLPLVSGDRQIARELDEDGLDASVMPVSENAPPPSNSIGNSKLLQFAAFLIRILTMSGRF